MRFRWGYHLKMGLRWSRCSLIAVSGRANPAVLRGSKRSAHARVAAFGSEKTSQLKILLENPEHVLD